MINNKLILIMKSENYKLRWLRLERVCLNHFHHGGVLVLKSVSVQLVRPTESSSPIATWARARLRGAGPLMTLPVASYWDP